MSLYVYIEKSIINKKLLISKKSSMILTIPDEDVYKNNPGPFVLIATSTIVKSFGGKYN